jgi:hypothetical protein
MYFESPDDSDFELLLTGTCPYPDNCLEADTRIIQDAWNHFLFTKANNMFQFFVNGENLGTINWSFTQAVGNYSLMLGTGSGEYFGDNFFDGEIDDFRIYNRAVTEDEIQILYHEGGWGR